MRKYGHQRGSGNGIGIFTRGGYWQTAFFSFFFLLEPMNMHNS
jgi:hypothetical protein